ncbi:hypothetical protein EDB19DRAFT_1316365 [Suillus lakei]|nr:hypothetical protein EDB19DRAFT_1316365 [Suillus lakei]
MSYYHVQNQNLTPILPETIDRRQDLAAGFVVVLFCSTLADDVGKHWALIWHHQNLPWSLGRNRTSWTSRQHSADRPGSVYFNPFVLYVLDTFHSPVLTGSCPFVPNARVVSALVVVSWRSLFFVFFCANRQGKTILRCDNQLRARRFYALHHPPIPCFSSLPSGCEFYWKSDTCKYRVWSFCFVQPFPLPLTCLTEFAV